MHTENRPLAFPTRFIVGIALVLLLIVGSGIFIVVEIESANVKADHHPPKTTATATPSATPALSSTPSTLFSDSFIDNSKGWYIGETPGYTRILTGEGLTLSDTNHKTLVESVPTSTNFSDFSLTLAFKLTIADAHDSVGLYVRGDSNLDHDYRIDIFGDGSYAISKEWLDSTNRQQITYLADPTPARALKPLGQLNTLKVVMKGSTLDLSINGASVSSITDTDYIHGQIALFVANGGTSSGVTATFSSILIEPVEQTAR